MAKLTWNDDVGPNLARQATAAFAAKAQAILDDVHASASGHDVAAVKATLRTRWQIGMGQLPDEALLDKFADRLAAGQRVVLSPTGTQRVTPQRELPDLDGWLSRHVHVPLRSSPSEASVREGTC